MTNRNAVFTDLSREMLSEGVGVRFRAGGWSMHPIIRDADVVEIEPADLSRVRYGDIVFFRDDHGRPIVHRVVKKRRSGDRVYVETKGDSAPETDGYFDGEIFGRVVSVEKPYGTLRLDRGMWRILNAAYAALLPFSKWAFIIASAPLCGRVPDKPPACAGRDEYYKTGARNAIIYDEAKKILRAFDGHGIKTMVLKGLFLAGHVYGNIATRPMTDIDILIRREDLAPANEALGLLGYPSPAEYEDCLKNSRLSPINSLMYFVPGHRRPSVHLHWHIINTTWPLERTVEAIDMERIWKSARTISIDGAETLAMSPEHLLIYLAHHAIQHSFDKPAMVSDIVETIRYYGDRLDWNAIREEAERAGLLFIVYASLRYASKASGAAACGMETVRPRKRGILEKMVLRRIEKGRCSYGVSYCAYLAAQNGLLDKAAFLFRTLFPSASVKKLRRGRT